jgi:uncharacterized protein
MFRRFLANQLVLRPTRDRLEHDGLARIVLPCSPGNIEAFVGWLRPSDAGEWTSGPWVDAQGDFPDLLILKLSGVGGRAERSTMFPANLLDGRSSEVWTWNPPGYGRSAGRATLQGIASVAVEFFAQVIQKRRGPQTKVWIFGNSLGCATGLYLATQCPVEGLVLRNPPPLVELIRTRDAWWNLGRGGSFVAGGVPPEMDALLTASEILAPIVFIESGADSLVTPVMQSYVRDAHPGPQVRILLYGAEHDSPIDDSYRDELFRSMQWLWTGGVGLAQ